MPRDVTTLTQAIELVAAGSWAIDSAVRCLEAGDAERARQVLVNAQATVRDGLAGLREVLHAAMQDVHERPERLMRALASLEELRGLQELSA